MTRAPVIPIVDISGFREGGAGDRVQVARAFGTAFEQVGFATVVGHGVNSDLIQATYAAMQAFFALPEAQKLTFTPPEKAKARGYLPVGIESVAATLDNHAPPDLCEALVFANIWRARNAAGPLPTIWPDRPADLKQLVERYNTALLTLGQQLAQISALALDLPQHYLDPYFADPEVVLRFVNYADQPEPPKPGQLRYGAHHDYGGLTILRQDQAPGGLEVRDVAGVWHAVPPSDEGFVINIGDLMSRWTNGRWRSTLHRVANPARELTGSTQRLSMVCFFSPNQDSEIAALPSCVSLSNPARWPAVTAGRYIHDKIMKSMDLGTA